MGYEASNGLFDMSLVEGYYGDVDYDFEDGYDHDYVDPYLEVLDEDWLNYEAGLRKPEFDCA